MRGQDGAAALMLAACSLAHASAFQLVRAWAGRGLRVPCLLPFVEVEQREAVSCRTLGSLVARLKQHNHLRVCVSLCLC